GWILAIAEAGVVGGLADWFAVTALFRRPLGLPIPHTGLIPANWELMAARVGTMVGDRVLTAEYVSREIARADLAGLLARAAALDRPEIHEAVGDAVDVVLGDYRQRLGFYPSLLIGLAGMLGLIDRKRLIGALRSALHNVASDPNDPLRRRLGESLAGLPARL